MYDMHIHIGPFKQAYYDYKDVFSALKNNNVERIVCAYLTPKFSETKSASEYYNAVLEELKEALSFAKKVRLNVAFLHWADPLLFTDDFSLNQLFEDFNYATGSDYYGIALHPGLHKWTSDYAVLLTELFVFAKVRKIPLFIHTGVSEYDNPVNFEKWFADFPEVNVHLAHCKDPDPIIKLFSKYENLAGDTAFCPLDSYTAICNAGFKNRMFFGTDFPITHWYEHYGEDEFSTDEKTLTASYAKTLQSYSEFLH